MEKTPYIRFNKIGDSVTGEYIGHRVTPSKYTNKDGSAKNQVVHDLSIKDLNATAIVSGQEANVVEDATVTVFGSARLDELLSGITAGKVITITFKGKLQKKGKGKGKGTFEEKQWEVK